MAKRDFYEILGVSRDADDKEIKAAYRKLAMKNHPDRNPNDASAAERFREASEAYEILKDSQKRAAYDQLGHAAFDQQSGFGSGSGPFGGGFSGFSSGGFTDIFEQMFSEFSGGRDQNSSTQGSDLRYDLSITLEEAYLGCDKEINTNISVRCDSCNGNGSEKGSRPVNCNTCGGAGKVRAQQGFFTVERTCPKCNGAGEMISNPCKICNGNGRVEKHETLTVPIPKGVDNGNKIRLSGKGEAGLRGGPSGDLYIVISVNNHDVFYRDSSNINIIVPIPMVTAAIGGSVEVPTLSGKIAKLQIESGTQTGKKFRMRGKGMPELRGGRYGDQIVEIHVETPTNLNKKQINLLKEFQENGEVSPQTSSFINNIKNFWN